MNNQIHTSKKQRSTGFAAPVHSVNQSRAIVDIYRGNHPLCILKISDTHFSGDDCNRLRITVSSDQNDQWYDTSRFIRQRYLHAFDACIDVTFPELIWVTDRTGAVLAAAGVRPAGLEPLFLEQYLQASIEQTIGVSRNRIVEIGNLVSVDRDATVLLFSALALILERRGVTHAAATGTRLLEKRLRALSLQMVRLCEARVDQLDYASDQSRRQVSEQWGKYYQASPHVLVGSVPDCAGKLRSRLSVELGSSHCIELSSVRSAPGRETV